MTLAISVVVWQGGFLALGLALVRTEFRSMLVSFEQKDMAAREDFRYVIYLDLPLKNEESIIRDFID